eukprot:XP_015576907.1 uncharacterized protein At4g18490 [Ricinus communis]
MAESQKGNSACTDPQKKKSPLDEEIGNEFLNSWKTLSTVGDEPMDFNFDTVSSGKKKTFNFDNLDMDFNLDGDFDKLASFKVDMPELDFSSPCKNTAKSKESSKGDSSSGNHRGKRDCFNFSFEFNDLDNFNFGPTLTEGEKTPAKNLDSKGPDSDRIEHQGAEVDPAKVDEEIHQGSKANRAGVDDGKNQGLKVNPAGGADGGKYQRIKVNPADFDDGQTDKLLASDNTTTSVVETTVNGEGTGISSSDKFPSRYRNIEDLVVTHGSKSLPEKTISASSEEADQQSQSLEKTMPTVPYAQKARHILPVQAVDGNDFTQDAESSIQAGVLATKENSECNLEHNVSDRVIVGGSNHENSQLKNSAASWTSGSESIRGEIEKSYSERPAGNVTETGPMPDELDLEATCAASHLQERLHECKADKDIQKSTLKVLVPLKSSCSAPIVDKAIPTKEKDSGVVRSKFLKSSKEIEPQLCQPPSAGLKVSSFSSKGISSLCPANGKSFNREGFNVHGAQSQRKLTGTNSLSMELKKEETALPGSEKNVKNLCNISSNVNPASSTDRATKSNTPASAAVVSSIGSTWNSKLISLEGLKAGKGMPDLSSLKISRTLGVNKDQSNSVLKREISSLRNSEKNMEVQGFTASKIVHPIVSAERETLPVPSLKRKTSEASNENLQQLNPRKRLSQSPSESRNLKETSESTVEEEPESDPINVLRNHPHSGLELPQQLSMEEQNISLAMENDGNVAKAEAYAKELEDICSMLKKKHEEAKEILVRAIVNNNSLLMLNHPMFDEKISFTAIICSTSWLLL